MIECIHSSTEIINETRKQMLRWADQGIHLIKPQNKGSQSEHCVWLPLASIQAWRLLLIVHAWWERKAWETFYHSWTSTYSSSCNIMGALGWHQILHCISSHTQSMGTMSSDFAGHGKVSISACWRSAQTFSYVRTGIVQSKNVLNWGHEHLQMVQCAASQFCLNTGLQPGYCEWTPFECNVVQ